MRGIKAGAVGGMLLIGMTACSPSGHAKSSAATSTVPPTTVASTTTVAPTTTKAPSTTVGSAVASNIKVYGDCKTAVFEPKEIILACGDLGSRFEGLSWTAWTSKGATGAGTWTYNDCTPDCASGHIHSLATRVTLTVPVRDPSGQLVWSQIQETAKPPGYDPGPQSLPTRPD